MFDFFTLLFVVLLLMEAIGGVLLVGWWMQKRGGNTLAWWSLAHGVGVLMLWGSWYAVGPALSNLPYADLLLGGFLLVAVVPAFAYLMTRMLRAEAKLHGTRSQKNLWHYFASVDSAETDRLAIELRMALERPEKQLSVEYQPIFNAATRHVVSFEALVRWHHPVRGAISPAQFIPIAEASGSILPLGQWVLETACATAVRWPQPWLVSVNVSPVQLRQSRLVSHVRDALRHSGLAANRLQLEITEGVMIDSASQVMARLSELRSLGVRIAIDDFGTGYSSLRYLEHLPCDTIKIDRLFVHDLEHDQAARSITSAVINLCHELGHEVVAEGVETEGQLSVLNALKCQAVQGWLLGKAMPPERIGPVFGNDTLYEGGRAAREAEQALVDDVVSAELPAEPGSDRAEMEPPAWQPLSRLPA
ncbi:EAL domain-containing protein [Achromobacter sp. GG226]|uniref:putative bifunctional diguanylate cyclase/phosphodiesterase n=1 Tax=Verticiella alkaliphila TaxID=2779529 RepID=UPI001C0BF8C5|nr:EAL domain-containing protein [Verticiella sp. GG226]MBU4610482.1 EAL domain-containing protein [Verticiella sp. GG226]